MAVMSGAKALVKVLEKQKVKVIFGIPGGALLDVYDELCDSDIRHILMRHEQCAAHAADGYARASRRVGVCMATSGPGATNLVTGIATAYMDSSPIVAFTGQVPKFFIGRDAFQEVDTIGITNPITKHNFQVRSAAEIPRTVKAAFLIASSGRPGPVLVDLPKDTQQETADIDLDEEVKVRGIRMNSRPHPLQVKKAAELLIQAERPMIIAGGGVIMSGASQELVELAELLMAPVATTLMGKGCIPENHPLATGLIGMHGTPASNRLVLEADVVLAVGMRFSDRTTGKPDAFCPDAKIIHIDIDPAEIGKNVRVDIPIVADAKHALHEIKKLILEKAAKKQRSAWLKKLKELKQEFEEKASTESGLKPTRLMAEIRRLLPENAIITTEVGQNQMWAALYLKAYKPRTFLSSGGLGTMGSGFPIALGAKVAHPEVPVVDIAGDGSFIMTEQDLAASVAEDIPVIVVVLNNSMLGMVAQWQRLFYRGRYSSVKLGKIPDFVKLAEAYGAQGFRAESIEEFTQSFKSALKTEVTTVIDVPISSEENVLPMVPAGKSLKDIIWR